MSVCRYLPVPSERMGILWSLLEIKEAVVLEFGPSGTTHFSLGTLGDLGVNVDGNLYATHIDESDVVMGDSKRIEESLLEIDREYKPKYIFVVGSSVSSIIATDLKGICSSMENQINAKMIAFEGGGFRGDYALGIREVLDVIAKEIVKPCSIKKENTFNIVGACSEEYRLRSNIEEIKSIMKECFDFEVVTSFTLDTSIKEIEDAGSASVNLVIRSEGLLAAEVLQEKIGTPFIYGAPYGYSGTLEWIEAVGKLIGKEPSKEYINKVKKSMANGKRFYMYKYMIKTPLKASIIGNYDMVLGLKKFFKEDIGFDIGFTISRHSLKNCNNQDEDIKYIESEKARINILKECEKSLILGDDISLSIANESNVKVRVSSPTLVGEEFVDHMPLMGYKGGNYLLESVSKYIKKIIQEI